MPATKSVNKRLLISFKKYTHLQNVHRLTSGRRTSLSLAKKYSQHLHLKTQPRQFLSDKLLSKKKELGKMLIEQIIEVELRGPGPPSRTWFPKTGHFHDKTKISKPNTRVIIYC